MSSPSLDPQRATNLGSQVVRSVLARYAVVVVGIAISVLLSRFLAADGRGAYSYVIALATIIAWIAHSSVETSLFLSWSSSQNRRVLVGAALAIGLLVGSLVAFVVGGWILLADPATPQGVESWMLTVAISTTPVALVALYANAVLANDGRIDEINRVALWAASIQLATVAVLIAFAVLTVTAAVLVWVASILLPVLLLAPKLLASPGLARPDVGAVLRLLKSGLKYHPGAVALALILRVDVLLLGSRVTVAQLGIYTLAVALVEVSLVASGASSQVALQVQVRGDPYDHAGFAAGVARANSVLAGGMLIVLALVGRWAITFVFGDSYEGTLGPILVLAPGVLALAILRPLAVFLTRLNRPFYISVGLVSGLLVNVLLNLMLIPSLGILGAAAASSGVYVGLLVWIALWFLKESRVSARLLIPGVEDLRAGWESLRRPFGSRG